MGTKPTIFIDTNILLSGLLFPRGNEHKILQLSLENKVHLILAEPVIEEANRIFNKRFPHHIIKLKKFLTVVNYKTVGFPDKTELEACRNFIRDKSDLPILVSAINAQPDYFISGDNDFLHCEAKDKINIIKSKDFLKIINS